MKKLEDRPELLSELRKILARRLGAPVDPPPPSLWSRIVRWWRS